MYREFLAGALIPKFHLFKHVRTVFTCLAYRDLKEKRGVLWDTVPYKRPRCRFVWL